MKKLLTLAAIALCIINVACAQTGLHTSGKHLLDICGDTLVLRGVDYAAFNWGNDNSDETGEIEKTGANCVRIPWYVNPGGATYYTSDNLDTVITHCIAHHMVPIIELHDQTCANDPQAVTTMSGWFTQSAIKSVLLKHKAYVIANLANEALYHNWDANPQTAVNTYVNTYTGIISTLRNAGFEFPLMIDAPDCGTDIALFSTVASTLTAADTKHNLIFSSHAYWYGYANNDSMQMLTLISNAAALNYPVILGEFGNYQDDPNPCDYQLNYTALLHICERFKFPWISWVWNHDVCAARQLSSNGSFNSLTAYGNDVVNNTGYGLKYKAVRSAQLLNGGVGCTTGINNETLPQQSLLAKQPGAGVLQLQSVATMQQQVMLADLSGRIIWTGKLNAGQTEYVNVPAGLYIINSSLQHTVKQVVY